MDTIRSHTHEHARAHTHTQREREREREMHNDMLRFFGVRALNPYETHPRLLCSDHRAFDAVFDEIDVDHSSRIQRDEWHDFVVSRHLAYYCSLYHVTILVE
jgi:putative NADPH-quinone reductase